MTPAEATRLAQWASLECEKQRSGERSVGRMVEGWLLAYELRYEIPKVSTIQSLGKIVEPRTNSGNWRRSWVRVGMSVKASPEDVPRLMENLIDLWNDADSDEWYREFEEIHPFGDGNGRCGNILWNWRRGSLEPSELAFPPDYWNQKRLEFSETNVTER